MNHILQPSVRPNILLATLALLIAASPAVAQPQASLNAVPVAGQGSASMSVAPETMRVLILLKAEGKSVEAAASAMEETLEAARLELTALGATKDSFKTDDLKVDTELGDKYSRLRSEMMSYGGGFGGRGRPKMPEPKVSDVVRVKQYLAADWPLEKSGVPLLAQSVDLGRKLKEIDFGGSSSNSDLSPEEAEMLEEAGMFMDEEEEDSGPKIFYIASITREQKNELQEEALQMAKSNAEEMARLVDKQIGDVLMIQSSDSDASPYNQIAMSEYGYGGYGRGETPPQQLIVPQSRQKLFKVSDKPAAQQFQIGLRVGYEFSK